MPPEKAVHKTAKSGQVGLGHLLLAIVFFMPMSGAVTELKNFGGGDLRYLIAVPCALAAGSLVTWLDWKLGKILWTKGQRHSRITQDVVAIALLALELCWIVVGGVSGFKVAAFVARHIPR
jgi:hypothetical protein